MAVRRWAVDVEYWAYVALVAVGNHILVGQNLGVVAHSRVAPTQAFAIEAVAK